jgi:hypothetical protein
MLNVINPVVWAGVVLTVLVVFGAGVSSEAGKLEIRQINGQADVGTVEIHGVSAGEFSAGLWEKGTLNLVPDVRLPLLEPRKRGMYRNIYAPSIVETAAGWRLFYGAWDGVETGNDRIYSTDTLDFIDFTDRKLQIDHGDFIHCCNVSALRLPDGSYRMMCTVYPDKRDRNKPATFTSPDGIKWNSSEPSYAAKMTDIIDIQGYSKYADADINGMNVILYEDGVYRLYFNNFKDFGKIYRASSEDGKNYKYDGPALDFSACVNDVKKITVGKETRYLMGMHMNGDTLWYSLSKDGVRFDPPKPLGKNLGDKDRYMVAIGWVLKGNSLLGFLYGAGEVPTLDRNRIWARWLQKKVVFVASDGTRYEGSGALGPDRQIIRIPKDKTIQGRFEVYSEDSTTPLLTKVDATLVSGAVFVLAESK